MAKLDSYTDLATVEHEEAYARIVLVNLDYCAREARVDVAIYHTQQARFGGAPPVFTEILTFQGEEFDALFCSALELPDVCPRSAVYEWLSTQPAWAGWSDV